MIPRLYIVHVETSESVPQYKTYLVDTKLVTPSAFQWAEHVSGYYLAMERESKIYKDLPGPQLPKRFEIGGYVGAYKYNEWVTL